MRTSAVDQESGASLSETGGEVPIEGGVDGLVAAVQRNLGSGL